ncbi:VQ motif-containing protein 8 [Spatholobus suberectus]|nr:VQ motif-containing protein 8 [Spatholobus suberectus]
MDSQASRHKPLQGPKPASLMVNRSSTKIKKQQQHLSHHSPVIVHLRSPKVIHVRPEEFMGLVQQLTGNPVSASAVAAHSLSHPGSYMKDSPQKMEKRSTVTIVDENPIEDFICSIGHTGISVDFQALMQL